MNVNEIGMMVRAIRVVKGLNQAELAEKSEVDPAYVSRLERGLMTLPEKYMVQLEKALGVSFDAVRPSFEQFAAAVLADGDGSEEAHSD
jgi:transcriptional regulator with XRE-family HTH domain